MRVAWLGPAGGDGGVPALGALLLTALADTGADIHVYFAGAPEDVQQHLRDHPRVHVRHVPSSWSWDAWYARTPITIFVASLAKRAAAHRRLVRLLVRDHAAAPLDLVFQFSQAEFLARRDELRRLPPLVLHPCTHARGELRWHRRESAYARRSEPAWRHWLIRLWLEARARLQPRWFRRAELVIGPAKRFNELVAADYGIPPTRFGVLRHPVDVTAFAPAHDAVGDDRRLRVVVISRFAVRKGIDVLGQIVDAVVDADAPVEFSIVGGPAFWSDYEAHVQRLEGPVCRVLGSRSSAEVAELLRTADVLLVPSRYEPGSIVVSEALASGVPVLASSEVGPAELAELGGGAVETFRDGDAAGAVAVLQRLAAEPDEVRSRRRRVARDLAERELAPAVAGTRLRAMLDAVAAR